MKFTLNPYTLIANTHGEYCFILADIEHPIKLSPNDEQLKTLNNLYNNSFFEYDELCKIFNHDVVDALIKTGCFVPVSIDAQSMFSRTDAFFLTHNMPNARTNLNNKKVLILGCGGIGTHMAWHMTTLGVKKITLVDFDTVEESNLNRQLLFDCNDVGLTKTDVLKSKLAAINPNIQIETICSKIMSEKELENICLSDHYDLIIKALDSPAEFPIWLDHVAKEHKLPYIAGITMRENVLIGPSYIPDVSSVGWSDLMRSGTGGAEKVFGTAPSFGILLYHISDELAIEAFKILSGYGSPKYIDKIVCKNVITDKEEIIDKKDTQKALIKDTTSKKTLLLTNAILMIVLILACSQKWWFIPLLIIISLVIPFMVYNKSGDIIRYTFINSSLAAIGILTQVFPKIDISNPSSLISSVVILFTIYSITTLFSCLLSYCVQKVFSKHKNKKYRSRG